MTPHPQETPICGHCLLPIHSGDNIRYCGRYMTHEHSRCVALLRQELAAAVEAKEKAEREAAAPCEWKEDEEGCWDTGCGNKFFFNDGGVEENGCKFCHYCGHPVSATKYIDPPVDDKDAESIEIAERLTTTQTS